MIEQRSETRRSAADRFAGFCAAVVRVLPLGLSRVVAPTFLGFCLINGFTFAVDLALLRLLYGQLGWSLPLAITIGYAVAFSLSFLLNRGLNFRSHAPVGPQAGLYVLVVAINFLVFIQGVGSGLTAIGVNYLVSRLAAGACEGVFMYCAMRWVVFRRPRQGVGRGPAPRTRVGGTSSHSDQHQV